MITHKTSDSKEGRSPASPEPAGVSAVSSAPSSNSSAVPSATAVPVHQVGWTPSQLRPRDLRAAYNAAGSPADTQANQNNKQHSVREYTLGEEVANSITHGLGVALGIVALILCIISAVNHGGGLRLAAALIYGITMILEYLMSTLYHALAVDKAKRVFKVLDHSAIYLYIAGCYTPVCFISLIDSGGIPLCIVVWVLALIGVACEAFWVFRPRWISAVLYLLLGWCVAWCFPALVAALPTQGLVLFIVGGVCYTVGCIFYVLKKIPYMHSIFHVWVLAGSIFQFFAIYLYII